jgi:hypothetical protein
MSEHSTLYCHDCGRELHGEFWSHADLGHAITMIR